jgi:hypothetical protein
MSGPKLWLGDATDDAHERKAGEAVGVDADDLTTHGVIVGMTGSGKTGLGIVLIEEALAAGIPTLVLDPKGDMGNLLLQFPEVSPSDLQPWVAKDADAAAVAKTWDEGLTSWGIDGPKRRAMASSHDAVVYTPGSTAGVALNLFGALDPPSSTDAEVIADEAESIVAGLLGLVGIDADPLSSREHILLVNLLHRAWEAGQPIDLATLVTQVQSPPLRKLGVIELDTFFPPSDRMALALKLNGLLASPAFAAWNTGVPLDIEKMLWGPGGRPNAAIVYLAHLSDDERQTVVALVLSKLVSWMRTQPGSTSLRVLVYMDEVAGFAPPTAAPPAKKPILTILKQARAFGVGMVLATQNPVDLDYKALSNAGTWMVGRLQTERDKARLLDGMTSAAGAVDIGVVDATISGLAKREFLLQRAGGSGPRTFGVHWALSYLAGPLAKEQLALLPGMDDARGVAAGAEVGRPEAAATPMADDEVGSMPKVASGVPVRWLDPGAPWGDKVRAVPGSPRHRAGIAVRVALRYDDPKVGNHDEEFEAIYPVVAERVDPSWAVVVDYDDRDLRPEPPSGAVYQLPPAPLEDKAYFTALERSVKDHLYSSRTVAVLHNPTLRLVSRPGEAEDTFRARCDAAAQDLADAAADKLRAKYAARVHRTELQLARAIDRKSEVESSAKASRNSELFGDAGSLLGAVLGGRSRTRSIVRGMGTVANRRGRSATSQRRLESADNKVEDLRDAVADVEADLADELAALDTDWQAKGDDIQPMEIGLEKTDITIKQVAVVWVPY